MGTAAEARGGTDATLTPITATAAFIVDHPLSLHHEGLLYGPTFS